MGILVQGEISLATTLTILIILTSGNDSCSDTKNILRRNEYSQDLYPRDEHTWYNTTFWGGYELIAWKENIPPHCWNSYTDHNFVVLSERHPAALELTGTLHSLTVCLMNQGGNCIEDGTAEVINCGGDILYRISTLGHNFHVWDAYICFDRIYEDTCVLPSSSLPAVHVADSISLIKVQHSNIGPGWYASSYGGQNYTIPVLKDEKDISERCDDTVWGVYRYDIEPVNSGSMPTGIRVCLLSGYNLDDYDYYDDYDRYRYKCNYHLFVTSCNGMLLFDLSVMHIYNSNICLVRTDNVKVLPKIHHVVETISQDGITYNKYIPSLEYICSFQMKDGHMYKVKWYINGTLLQEEGPTSNAEGLVLKEEEIQPTLDYKVKCSVSSVEENATDTFEIYSEEFFAGYKISDRSVELPETDYRTVTVQKTVPTGCTYTDRFPAVCEEVLTLEDDEDPCLDCILSLNANDHSASSYKVKTLKMGEEWQGSQYYTFYLETVDNTYDDRSSYSLRVMQTGVTEGQRISKRDILSQGANIKVAVVSLKTNVNKFCYSHSDPHMRTGDSITYEQQRTGDYMLYRNIRYKLEVQERTEHCYHNRYNHIVCACAVIVRAGQDVFKINRCPREPSTITFIGCGQCGMLDVVKHSDSLYEVFMPIGTRVIIKLLNHWGSGRNMNIDIYLAPKDERETDGLCGFFDGDDANDFISRNRKRESGNHNYEFSESWRLRERENLFKNPQRPLDKLDKQYRQCTREKSITQTKCSYCSVRKRKRRNILDGMVLEMASQNKLMFDYSRAKRRSEINITEEDAEAICRQAIYNAPAVKEFPDKLAGEDPEHTIFQCVYDVTHGNDASWAEAHVIALNNIVKNILNLNPIFKSNNSETVETFLTHTCTHNCSNNGVCSKEDVDSLRSGLCICGGVYRGDDCSIDVRIPPLIYEVNDGGRCDTTGGTECRCFLVNTDNIFEGFKCHITSFKMTFNGMRRVLGRSQTFGEYDDVYNGECCSQVELTKREDFEAENIIKTYDISISNDGVHFGDVSSVYVYDPTCLRLVKMDDVTSVELKDGYCFIDQACVVDGSTHFIRNEDKCCKPNVNLYKWTDGQCGPKDSGITTVAVIGIVAGSVSAVAIVSALLIYLTCCKQSKRRRTVAIENDNQTQIERLEYAEQRKDVKAQPVNNGLGNNGTDWNWAAVLPDLSTPGAGKPVCRRDMWNFSKGEGAIQKDEDEQDKQNITVVKALKLPGLGDKGQPDIESAIATPRDGKTKPERGLSEVSLKIF